MRVEQALAQYPTAEQADIGLHKNNRPRNRRREGRAARGRGEAALHQATDQRLDAAGIAHPCDQRADQQAKQQDARIARALEHTDRTVDRAQCAHAGMEAGDQRLRSQQGEPQRSIDIARHQRDEDRQYRRQYSQDFQGPASLCASPSPKRIRRPMPSALRASRGASRDVTQKCADSGRHHKTVKFSSEGTRLMPVFGESFR